MTLTDGFFLQQSVSSLVLEIYIRYMITLSHKVSVLIAGECTYSWVMKINTNVENGSHIAGASTVDQCKLACINNTSCTGFTVVLPNCWMSGPWSGQRNEGTAFGYVHVDLTRTCTGSESFL